MKKSLFLTLGVVFIVSGCGTGSLSRNDGTAFPPTPIAPPVSQQTQQSAEPESLTKTYQDQTNGITFSYPSNLSVTKSVNKIIVQHSVPFQHSSPCDFIGTGEELPVLTDFNVSLEVYKKSLKDTVVETQDESFMKDNMTGDTLIVSEGYIDTFKAGDKSGYRVTQGVEGCGRYVYFFPLKEEVTLVVIRSFVPELNSVISEETRSKAEKLPNVILAEQSDKIFAEIINSIEFVSTI